MSILKKHIYPFHACLPLVKSILESGIDLPQKTESLHDLKALCLALLDNLNDKNLALTHQKKTNKLENISKIYTFNAHSPSPTEYWLAR